MNVTIEANRESIVNAVREWSPVERAALIRDVAETLVEQDEEDSILPGLKAIETEEMRQIRLGWEAERANGTLDKGEDLSWMDDLNQEQIVARLKAEWEKNRQPARKSYVLRPPHNTLAEIYGVGNAEHPGPSDEEVEQWLHEHKMEKYG